MQRKKNKLTIQFIIWMSCNMHSRILIKLKIFHHHKLKMISWKLTSSSTDETITIYTYNESSHLNGIVKLSIASRLHRYEAHLRDSVFPSCLFLFRLNPSLCIHSIFFIFIHFFFLLSLQEQQQAEAAETNSLNVTNNEDDEALLMGKKRFMQSVNTY